MFQFVRKIDSQRFVVNWCVFGFFMIVSLLISIDVFNAKYLSNGVMSDMVDMFSIWLVGTIVVSSSLGSVGCVGVAVYSDVLGDFV